MLAAEEVDGVGARVLCCGQQFFSALCQLEAGLPCLRPSLPPSSGNQQLQPVGHGE